MATKTTPAEGMRRCIGSAKYSIEAHDAPIADFPAQPSQKDGLGRMCKPHWTIYTRALRTASQTRKAGVPEGVTDAMIATSASRKAVHTARTAKPARLKPETKAEKAMRVPIVRAGAAEPSGSEAQAALLKRVRAAGGSLPANGEAEPPEPRATGRRSRKAADAAVDAAVDEHVAALEAQAAEEIAREPETMGVNRGEFASEGE